MSENSTGIPHPARRPADRGMTLPEVLITVTLMGIIVLVLSTAITVTLRQQRSTEGRLNVAVAEQNVSVWMPADLASAAAVSTDPAATGCDRVVAEYADPGATDGFVVTGDLCPDLGIADGSNVLLLGWRVDDTDVRGSYVNVSYYFAPAVEGETYELHRIECTHGYERRNAGGALDRDADPMLDGSSWSCQSRVVLRDLPPNLDSNGNVLEFVPGVTRPDWVIKVSQPLDPNSDEAADSEGPASDVVDQEWRNEQWKNANRVIVTIDGGGTTSGAGGGVNKVSITAGGTTRIPIDSSSLQGSPTFEAARGRCGGRVTLVIDESISIGATNIETVKQAVSQFVGVLEGTPVELQIVTFDGKSRVLGLPSPTADNWHRYFDMTKPSDVAELVNPTNGLIKQIAVSGAGGGGRTNWEEALFRSVFKPNGQIDRMPAMVVFFTDGVPTHGRNSYFSEPGVPTPIPAPVDPLYDPNKWNNYSDGTYHQLAYNRADWVARQFRAGTRFIGVGVGSFKNTDTSFWRTTASTSTSGSNKGTARPNSEILASLIAGDGGDIEVAERDGVGGYKNINTANLYLPDPGAADGGWSGLKDALKSVALGQCAGTLTLQTRVRGESGTFQRPFRYLARKVTTSDGTTGQEENKTVQTNDRFWTRTYNFEVKTGSYVNVELVPMSFSEVTEGYSTESWECRSAGAVHDPPAAPILLDGGWKGIAIQVQANRAVSCTHWLTPSAGG